MADINLSPNDDVYEHAVGKTWVNLYAFAGNDKIIIHGNASVNGGPGNDQIINDEFEWIAGSAVYWDSPNAIYVDLEAGYALDGWSAEMTFED